MLLVNPPSPPRLDIKVFFLFFHKGFSFFLFFSYTVVSVKGSGYQQTPSLIGSKLLFVSQKRPPWTVSACSESSANWRPSGKGPNERIPITSVYESDFTLERDHWPLTNRQCAPKPRPRLSTINILFRKWQSRSGALRSVSSTFDNFFYCFSSLMMKVARVPSFLMNSRCSDYPGSSPLCISVLQHLVEA